MVIVAADDPYMHSSQNEQDSRMIARAAHIPMLEPADSQECHDYIQRAFELSERSDTPVFLRLTQNVAFFWRKIWPPRKLYVPLQC